MNVERVNIGEKDQLILATAEDLAAIIISAHTWFLKELFRYRQGQPKMPLQTCWHSTGAE